MTKFYSLLMILVLLVSCKNESFIDFENQQNGTQQTNYNFGNSAQRNFHGLVLSTNGSPVSGANNYDWELYSTNKRTRYFCN